jgi:hypothetical protein
VNETAGGWTVRTRAAVLVAVVLPLALLHSLAVRGIVRGGFYADHGRWLHEIQRFADGQILYRDFVWPFPPLAMWVVGSPARLLGPGFAVISATTTIIFLIVSVLFALWVARLVRDPVIAVAVAVAAFLSALWSAQIGSSPLPSGMYSPAAPLGALFLLASLLAWLRTVRDRDARFAIVAGVAAALAVLTKQDFWVAAGVLTGGGTIAALVSGRITGRIAAANIGAAIATGLAGLGVVTASAGFDAVVGMTTGFGQAGLALQRNGPTLSRLTIEAIGLAGWLALLLFALPRRKPADGQPGAGRARMRAAAVFAGLAAAFSALWVRVTMSVAPDYPRGGSLLRARLSWHIENDQPLLRPALAALESTLAEHLLPVVGALVVLAILLRHRPADRDAADRRFLFAVLLSVAFALRLRRLFEYVEWYHYLIELPIYAGILIDVVRPSLARARRIALALLVPVAIIAAWQYHSAGAGPFTASDDFVPIETARGTVRLSVAATRLYAEMRRQADAIDPGGQAPLFAYGKTGGINYFLGRRNPTSSTHGFHFSGDPERVHREMSAVPAPIMFDVPVYDTEGWPHNSIGNWDTEYVATPYLEVDRPYFDDLLGRCARVGPYPSGSGRGPIFVAYACGSLGTTRPAVPRRGTASSGGSGAR